MKLVTCFLVCFFIGLGLGDRNSHDSNSLDTRKINDYQKQNVQINKQPVKNIQMFTVKFGNHSNNTAANQTTSDLQYIEEGGGKKPTIVGGFRAHVATSKYLVKIDRWNGRRWAHHCTGTVISSSRVLTAAHCFNSVSRVSQIRLFVGIRYVGRNYDSYGRNLLRTVRSIHVLRGYNRRIVESEDDIAIITINGYFRSSQPRAWFATRAVRDLTLVYAAGYGLTNSRPAFSPTYVQQVVLRLQPFSLCTSTWFRNRRHLLNIFKMTCASGPVWSIGGRSTCNGDSGGPLYLYDRSNRMVLLGVTSFGVIPCGVPRKGAFYAKISYYYRRIFDHVRVGDELNKVSSFYWRRI